MKQSRFMSMLESILSTAIGFGIALLTQVLVFPLFGFHPSLADNLLITSIFTVVSIARQFVLRRLFEALHIRRPLSPFVHAVIAERFRQIEVEGWSHGHDNAHDRGEMAKAGACYAAYAGTDFSDVCARIDWPWDDEWLKPSGFRRDLVKACALIVAEGEKHDRNRKRETRP